jgi:hypothetical protein
MLWFKRQNATVGDSAVAGGIFTHWNQNVPAEFIGSI